ncbi:MAG: glycosyltransferase family 2 protein [Paraglaciecola sp.]|nr:glycosyltransferase family 2 protein [Paraglaciecola sp.]
MNNSTTLTYSVVTFAHNEEKSIAATIKSIIANTDSRLNNICIVTNGCSDKTYDIALETLTEIAPCEFTVVNLPLGDKCNAWNHYVYQLLPECDVHFFVDSDVTFTRNAFPQLFDTLIQTDKTAVTGLPQSGRNIAQYTELATRYACLFGNLYGLKHEFLTRLVQDEIKLPVGLSWIDAQLTKLVNHNLAAAKDDYQPRVTCKTGVGYVFDSLKPWHKADIKLYVNRLVRYKVGQLQEVYLDALPFSQWPAHIQPINQQILQKGVSWRSLGKLCLLKPLIMQRLQKYQHDSKATSFTMPNK